MSKASRRNAEALLRGAVFSNPAHKADLRERLREHLTEGDAPLALDDLSLVTGGAALPKTGLKGWISWPGVNEKENRS